MRIGRDSSSGLMIRLWLRNTSRGFPRAARPPADGSPLTAWSCGRHLIGDVHRFARRTRKRVMFCVWLAWQCSSTTAASPYERFASVAQGRDGRGVRLRHFSTCRRGALGIPNLPVRVAAQVLAALLERLRMAVNGLNFIGIRRGAHQYAMIDRDRQARQRSTRLVCCSRS